MAEGIFHSFVLKRNLVFRFACDSCGTSAYHLGELPDKRMRQTAQRHQVDLTHQARQLTMADFANFDYVLAMDKSNLADILTRRQSLEMSDKGQPVSQVMLMRDFDPLPGNKEVPDPYFGGLDGFEEVYQMLARCNQALLDFLVQQHS